jgi:hypothetical protein
MQGSVKKDCFYTSGNILNNSCNTLSVSNLNAKNVYIAVDDETYTDSVIGTTNENKLISIGRYASLGPDPIFFTVLGEDSLSIQASAQIFGKFVSLTIQPFTVAHDQITTAGTIIMTLPPVWNGGATPATFGSFPVFTTTRFNTTDPDMVGWNAIARFDSSFNYFVITFITYSPIVESIDVDRISLTYAG